MGICEGEELVERQAEPPSSPNARGSPHPDLIQRPQKPQAPLYSSCGLMGQSHARQRYIDGNLSACHALKIPRSRPMSLGRGGGARMGRTTVLSLHG